MAAAMDSACSETNDVLIYIMPQRIQKSMLQDIRNGVKRTKLRVCEKYNDKVSHIVTQYTDWDQVVRQLRRDGADIADDADMEGVRVVTLAWLSACLKTGKAVEVQDKHLLKESCVSQKVTPDPGRLSATDQPTIPAWACQRDAPLNHHNHKFTEALETLEKHAELRNEGSDYSRALAFRRASCVLKSLPFTVQRLSQVQGLRDVGGHALSVIQSILEDGVCEEVQQVTDKWFHLMKEFTSVFGVGPATAKKWIDRGCTSVGQVRDSRSFGKDERVLWGLAFHEDLTNPVTVTEAERFVQVVKMEAEKILPGVIVTLTGGFRRGKQQGHDVDILMTHPEEGREVGLLHAVLQALTRRGVVLMGRQEASSFSQDSLTSDSKLVALRGQLDHFEKWLGICRFYPHASSHGSDGGTSMAGACETGGLDTDGRDSDVGLVNPPREVSEGVCEEGITTGKLISKRKSDSQAEYVSEPKPKHQKTENNKHHKYGENISSVPKSKQQKVEGTCQFPGHQRDTDHQKNISEVKSKQQDKQQQDPFDVARCERGWQARRVDLIVSPYSQYFYALVGWTGNKHFNRDLRLYATKELNMKLSSHGLWDFSQRRALPAQSEEEVFKNLKLEYREPSNRNC